METREYATGPEDEGRRLDVVLSRLSGLTRSQVQRAIDSGMVHVNGVVQKQNYRIHGGEIVTLVILRDESGLRPQNIPLNVFYMDAHLVTVDKPAGMVVYPAAGHREGTLMNAIAGMGVKLASAGAPLRPGVVHRLDRDTSGVMVVALDDASYYDLVEQFRMRTITRQYTALVSGSLKEDRGEIVRAIGRSASDRKKMSVRTRRGKEAVTRWDVVERLSGATLVRVRLGTGRTHQIRVHFAAIGYPVLGDRTYGKKVSLGEGKGKVVFPRQMLHAELLGFIHPVSREYMEFRSPMHGDMGKAIGQIRKSE